MSQPVTLCYCGTTFTIGLCHKCGRYVCGDHSVNRDGSRLCSQHVQARDQAVQRDQVKAAENKQAAELARSTAERQVRAKLEESRQRRFSAVAQAAARSLLGRNISSFGLAILNWEPARMTMDGGTAGTGYHYIENDVGQGWLIDTEHVLTTNGLVWIHPRGGKLTIARARHLKLSAKRERLEVRRGTMYVSEALIDTLVAIGEGKDVGVPRPAS